MSSIKRNVVLNAINTITGIIFPVITFPYAARVLLPEGIGAINFLNSIISYIVLLTSLGIPMYAVKEVAKYRDDKIRRDNTTIEILILSSCLCLLGYAAVWGLAQFVPQIHAQSALFYILSLTIVFTSIGVNWFYQGIEDFKYITARAIIIRILSTIALFVFVKSSSDLLIYGMIIVASTVGNNILNFIHLRSFIDLRAIKFRELNITRHIVPSLQVFIFNLICSLYIQLNTIMLGFMSGDDAVGYFSAGTKIPHIGLMLIYSLGTTLLPRCSHLIQIGDTDSFKAIVNKSLNLTLALSLPMTIGLMVLASPVIRIFCGEEYLSAIPVLLLNAPVIIFISLTSLLGLQILYPMDHIKIVIWSVSVGAFFNLISNIILIPYFAATGVAISTLIAEFGVLVYQIVVGRKYYPFKLKDIFNLKYIIGALIMGLLVYLVNIAFASSAIKLIFGVGIGMLFYAFYLMILKDPLLLEVKRIIFCKLKHE